MAVKHSDYKDAFDTYREYQNKFDYFFLAIIIGALSISIQSYTPKPEDHSIYLMVTTWILLAVSFVTGLIRRERILNFMRIESEKITYELKAQNYQQILENLRGMVVVEDNTFQQTVTQGHLGHQNQMIEYARDYLNILTNLTKVLYQVQKQTFVGALLAFGLFKMTNIYHISKCTEVVMLIIYTVISVTTPFIYRKFFKDISKKNKKQ